MWRLRRRAQSPRRQLGGQGTCPRGVLPHAGQPVAQPGQRRDRVRRQVEDRAAHPAAPEPRLVHHVLGAGQRRPGESLETLVEGDVDAVELRGDLGERSVVERLRLPDPRAVGVQGYAELPGRRGQLAELLPGGKQTSRVAQRQLHQRCTEPGREPSEPGGRRRLPARGQELELEPVQQARTVVLVLEQVGEVGDRHTLRVRAVRPDAERRLLGHHPAREERHGRLAEQLGHLSLDLGDRAAFGVDVPLGELERLGVVGHRAEHVGRRPGWMPEHGGVAGLGGRPESHHLLVVAHRSSQPARAGVHQPALFR